MTIQTQSEHRLAARRENPQARIEGDGPWGLLPCNPTGKLYLFWSKNEAEAVRTHWPCSPLCFGNHRMVVYRPAKPQPQPAQVAFRNLADMEKD